MTSGLVNAASPGKGVACPLHMVKQADGMDRLALNSGAAVSLGSKDALVAREFRELYKGIG